jgi:serine/threonine protein kinase
VRPEAAPIIGSRKGWLEVRTSGLPLCSANYMDPECLNRGLGSHQLDIFFIEVIVYEMLTAVLPYKRIHHYMWVSLRTSLCITLQL